VDVVEAVIGTLAAVEISPWPPPAVPDSPAPAHRRHRGRKLVAAGVAVLLAGTGTALVIAQPWATDAQTAQAVSIPGAAQKTLDAKTAKATVAVSLQGGPFEKPVQLTVDSAVDFTTGAASATTDLTPVLPKTGLFAGLDGHVELREQDAVAYVRSAFLDAIPGLSGKWAKVDLGAILGRQVGSTIGSLGSDGLAGALKALGLSDASSVTTVGHETVDGVDTTHQRVMIDVAKALQGKVDNAQLQQFLQLLGNGTVPVDVWIDGSGLVRKESFTAGANGLNATVNVSYRDIGAPVDVAPPPASDTIDLSSLLPH
jgi:hypothetical protein